MFQLDREWGALCARFGIRYEDAQRFYVELSAQYERPHRGPFTLEYVGRCLTAFDEARSLACKETGVELALWFVHIAHVPGMADEENLEASVGYARQFVRRMSLPESAVTRTERLMKAAFDRSTTDHDGELMADLERSIYGAQPEVYDAFETALRESIGHMPDADYNHRSAGRPRVLRGLLDDPPIYRMAHFQKKLEGAARQNVLRMLASMTRRLENAS